MPCQLAIQLEHVTKRYRAGRSRTRRRSDRVERRPAARHGATKSTARRAARIDATIWALRDVDASRCREGAGLGIIGRNGAGKTTLLKLISRVTWPTSGTVRVAGRVVSLIELGAGFHPELTGRENVYLGGGLFGLTRTRDRPAVRRDRRVRRRRAADRHADEALLVRAVRAARLQRGDLQQSRHRAGGRGAGGRRRGVPPPRARGAAPADRRGQDGAVHLARHVERAPAVQRDPVDGRRARARLRRRPARSPSAT